jgi:hypothetical protein
MSGAAGVKRSRSEENNSEEVDLFAAFAALLSALRGSSF